MPKLKNQPPKICRIKSNNAAVVYINGRTIYLGQWGSEKALQEYARFLTEWTNAEVKETVRFEKRTPTVAKLVAEFLKWAEKKRRFHPFLALQSRRFVSRQTAPTHARRRVRSQSPRRRPGTNGTIRTIFSYLHQRPYQSGKVNLQVGRRPRNGS